MSAPTSAFSRFHADLSSLDSLRAAIVSAVRRPEPECVPPLIERAAMTPDEAARTANIAHDLATRLRAKTRLNGVEGLIHEYSLSSQEGVALMCLAEALLRIPDTATRDALIRDKLAKSDWRVHVGHGASLFVNAATWGLALTGRLVATSSEQSLSAALTRLVARGGEPIIRRGVDLAMRMLGEHFVMGRTIDEALSSSRRMQIRGFAYSYDMLGEAAVTAEDAARYLAEYECAIHAIGKAFAGLGTHEGAGVSIKLSALHPRYSRAKRIRVMDELLPRVRRLAALAASYDIGFNIDAEEADRLDLSLDILDALSVDPALSGWNGLGYVVQAYGKRCTFVVDWLIDRARRSRRRLMVRLVKGAYWDAEIKRAQIDGFDGFPVFTRKVYTDVSYLACARQLLAAPDAVFPQFATHNAQTLAAVFVMAGPTFHRGQYEFQCLHGMGEALYEEVVGTDKLNRPCRVYAPVGSHDTLLAYLVRRLLENGANSSFVNSVADESIAIEVLVADPVAIARAIDPPGAPHDRIVAPRVLHAPTRCNSRGVDLADEGRLAALAMGLAESVRTNWTSYAGDATSSPVDRLVLNPADHRDVVGQTRDATQCEIAEALERATQKAAMWAATEPSRRAAILRRAADILERRTDIMIGLVVREAGKSFANAVGEVREAVDFLRYYAHEAERTLDPIAHSPLGPIACISPWNFPLAIFMGQVAAALVAGNPVMAKPAEQTPFVAAEAVCILHEAGAPHEVLALLPGAGEVGATLVADPRIQGVIFTGSTSVARLIQKQLAERLTSDGRPVPFIAETGGLNAMVIDSSALPEQVVNDVIASAFDSAGQRCSALRILCLQDDIADRVLEMLRGAMRELEIGVPDRLSVDVGPVISAEARDDILAHIETMRGRGHRIAQLDLGDAAKHGTFAPPTIIEINKVADLEREVFGPVLHVLRYARDDLDRLIDDVNALGYGLTFGLHTRIDETIARVVERIEAGNIYVNRNIIGAVVGVQPFGGSRLSGTGPKAGGPLYLGRLVREPPHNVLDGTEQGRDAPAAARAYAKWLHAVGYVAEAEACTGYIKRSPLGARIDLVGPVGETNTYLLRARGRIAALATNQSVSLLQLGAILATGNVAVVAKRDAETALSRLPADIGSHIVVTDDPLCASNLAGVLFEGRADTLRQTLRTLAARTGPIVTVEALTIKGIATGDDWTLSRLVEERVVTINTAAVGGSISLMTID